MTTLRIGRLASRYRVPPGPSAASVQARLDRVAGTHLAEACESLAAAVPEVAGDDVWLVRDLHVDLRLDLSATSKPGVVAQAWSHGLMAALRTQLARGTGAEVVRFPSQAAWTARFVAELVAGTAWDRWYLLAFSSLRALPTGRAIAEALTREPESALDVLAELWRAGDLESVLLALRPGDAQRILEAAVAPAAPPTSSLPIGRDTARGFAALTAAIRAPGDPHVPGAVLRLVAAAAARGVVLPPGADRVAAAVLWLAELARSGAEPRRLAAAVTRGRWAEALRVAGRSPRDVTGDALAALEIVRAVAGGDERWLTGLVGDLGPSGLVAGERPDEAGTVVATRFGGLLLVWPVFCDVWPVLDGDAVPRLLVASLLLGTERREALLHDPVLALLCGLERPPVPDALAEGRASLPLETLPGAAEFDAAFFGSAEPASAAFCALVLQRFAARLPGFADSSPGHLWRNFLDVPATVRLAAGAWEAAVTGPPLQVVLRMAGMSTLRYTLPWAPESDVTVELAWS